jgi:hypothetical protein
MTLAVQKEKKCAVCGKASMHGYLASTSVLGPSDLDSRPAPMLRSAIRYKIQACPSCGYCASDISEMVEKAPEIIRSDSYQQQLNNSEFPRLANRFLCNSLIQEGVGEYKNAGWLSVHAAWVCDDAGDGFDASAKNCRKRAVALFQKVKEKRENLYKRAGDDEALMTDLLRRAGEFESALSICEEGLKKEPEKIVLCILQLEKALIQNQDVGCYTIPEIEESKGMS